MLGVFTIGRWSYGASRWICGAFVLLTVIALIDGAVGGPGRSPHSTGFDEDGATAQGRSRRVITADSVR